MRPAIHGDIARLVGMGQLMHAESWFKEFDFDEDTVVRSILHVMTSPDCLLLVLENGNGASVGFFAGMVSSHFFGHDRYACDVGLYIVPACRGGPGFVKLVKAYEAWCYLKQVKEIHLGLSAPVDSERLARLYQRMGYHSPALGYRKKCVFPEPVAE